MEDGKINIEQWSKMSMQEKQEALRFTQMINEKESQIKKLMGEEKSLGIESRLGKIFNNPTSNTRNNILPIPQNEQRMPMFATDAEYMQYLQEYDPEMFMQMQNEYYNTRGTMGQGNILKGLLDSIMGGN
tara:strand:- start:1042 stop:1431 length:390 start_codon:yes stop_codon:yes gene_type:complete